MLFCERSFGIFFLLWGLVLVIDDLTGIHHVGEFYLHLRRYMPGWSWGALLMAIGLARFWAFRSNSRGWRIALSMVSCIVLVSIAALAFWAGRFIGTAPLAMFTAYIAFWCHAAMLRDVRLGL